MSLRYPVKDYSRISVLGTSNLIKSVHDSRLDSPIYIVPIDRQNQLSSAGASQSGQQLPLRDGLVRKTFSGSDILFPDSNEGTKALYGVGPLATSEF